jgi:NAD-dependent SIR2 family protein deacetylase
MSKTVVIAKCISCGHKKEIEAGEVGPGDVPTCPKCYMPMVADKATVKK